MNDETEQLNNEVENLYKQLLAEKDKQIEYLRSSLERSIAQTREATKNTDELLEVIRVLTTASAKAIKKLKNERDAKNN